MEDAGLRTALFLGAALLLGGVASGVVGCSGKGPQTTGTKTDWMTACNAEADCESEPELNCLCGICTRICTSDADCREGECGSAIATSATCGGDNEFVAAGEQICLPETGEECLVASLPRDSSVGAAELVSCEAQGALLCEDFEGLLPVAYSTWGDGETTAGLVECESQEGSSSLRIRVVDSGYTQTRMRLGTPVSAGDLYARFYLRVEGGGALPEQLIVFELWDQDEGDVTERTTLYLNSEQALEVYVGASELTLQAPTSTPIVRDEWHCLELGIGLHDVTGTVVLSQGGSPVVEATDVDTLPSDPISVAVIEGVPSTGSQDTEATFFIDDLIVATAPIGCD